MACFSRLNNQAVALFIDKRNQQAVDKLYEALCPIREIMNALPQDFAISANPSPDSSIRRIDVPIPYQCMPLRREDLFLYFRALALEGPPSDLHPSTLSVYCAVILFNIAILHHMEGISQGRMVFMDRACQLYHSSLCVLNGQDLSNNNTVLLLHLAVNNNLSQIELEKGLVDAANERLGYAFALLQTVKSRALSIFSRTELHGFLLNFSRQGKIYSAPAA